jgi:Ca2+ transporting ATPase
MSTVLNLPNNEPTEHGYPRRIHTKGASEIILGTCTHYLNQQGEKVLLDDVMSMKLKETITSYAKGALRTIAFAYKDLKENEGGPDHEEIREGSKIYEIEEGNYTLICIAGIKDIIRDEVPEAVALCNEAGVRVRMVTGDNLITAIAIAKECGIIFDGEENEECVCMEGPEFNEFVGSLVHKDTRERIVIMGKAGDKEVIGNPENMKIIRNKLKVLARSRPNDKYIMVTGLKQCGDIVAVTGDGTNDAPALKKADVGFAMKTGTQVAHGASDIIIQDDNFASIVKACKWGRNVFDNIRRFLQFQLTVNVVALITAFIGAVVMWESPLQAIQLLWVNLIMDSLASLALATEPPKDELLKRPPYRKREYIISAKMAKHIFGQGIYQVILLFVVVFAGHKFIPEEPSTSIVADLLPTHPVEQYRNWDTKLIFSGMVKGVNGDPIYEPMMTATPSRHFSIVFNLFVFFQIFNMLAARKINDEINIFEGVLTNSMFIIIWIIIVVG